MSEESKCDCQHCGGHIVFPIEAAGQTVECPHCKKETLLSLPPGETSQFVSCSCQHCNQPFEFDASQLVEENSLVPCPYCGQETKLFVPPAANNLNSALPTLADGELEAFVDRFSTEENFLKACDTYDAETKRKLNEIWLRNPRPSEAELTKLMEGLTPDEISQVLKIKGWNETMGFLQSLQKKKAGRMKIVSINNELELADDNIIIRRRGLANALASGVNGARTIQISTITAIQMKPAGIMMGYIVFSYAGSKPFMGGMWEATQDPDAFLFGKDLNGQVAEFKAQVEKKMRESKQPAPANNSSGTLTDELRKLAEFKNQGILSQAEFEAAKKKLLA